MGQSRARIPYYWRRTGSERVGRRDEGGGCESGGGRAGGGGRGLVDDPHAMGAGGDELCDGVGERAEGVDVEDGIGIGTIVDAALGKDDGDEVDAGGAEKREGC